MFQNNHNPQKKMSVGPNRFKHLLKKEQKLIDQQYNHMGNKFYVGLQKALYFLVRELRYGIILLASSFWTLITLIVLLFEFIAWLDLHLLANAHSFIEKILFVKIIRVDPKSKTRKKHRKLRRSFFLVLFLVLAGSFLIQNKQILPPISLDGIDKMFPSFNVTDYINEKFQKLEDVYKTKLKDNQDFEKIQKEIKFDPNLKEKEEKKKKKPKRIVKIPTNTYEELRKQLTDELNESEKKDWFNNYVSAITDEITETFKTKYPGVFIEPDVVQEKIQFDKNQIKSVLSTELKDRDVVYPWRSSRKQEQIINRLADSQITEVYPNEMDPNKDLQEQIQQGLKEWRDLNTHIIDSYIDELAKQYADFIMAGSSDYIDYASDVRQSKVENTLVDKANHIFKQYFIDNQQTADNALSSSLELQDFWKIKGKKGEADFVLKNPIKVKSISIDHLPIAIDPNPEFTPQYFKVQAEITENGEPRFVDIVEGRYLQQQHFTQQFELNLYKDNEIITQKLKLKIIDNYGGDETHVYKFRVHSDMLDKQD
ncbi:sad1/unc-84-like protein-related [Anaeramoeba flamelloides]|uniref:Sad1/unc-84-like protein-related n=1 Tax=Anaeramoeba flamelloides TaxID=1746091 RepID=A0AAV7ZEU2_9EUKA|nr:sad1/unc-84-like protein-related [Anaeramoeba flamelloides]